MDEQKEVEIQESSLQSRNTDAEKQEDKEVDFQEWQEYNRCLTEIDFKKDRSIRTFREYVKHLDDKKTTIIPLGKVPDTRSKFYVLVISVTNIKPANKKNSPRNS